VQIILEATNNLRIAVDGVEFESLVKKMIHIRRHLQVARLLNRQIRSQRKAFKGVRTVLHREWGVIASL
jgi:hypothetical protein